MKGCPTLTNDNWSSQSSPSASTLSHPSITAMATATPPYAAAASATSEAFTQNKVGALSSADAPWSLRWPERDRAAGREPALPEQAARLPRERQEAQCVDEPQPAQERGAGRPGFLLHP